MIACLVLSFETDLRPLAAFSSLTYLRWQRHLEQARGEILGLETESVSSRTNRMEKKSTSHHQIREKAISIQRDQELFD
jgi:hypothetical protein